MISSACYIHLHKAQAYQTEQYDNDFIKIN